MYDNLFLGYARHMTELDSLVNRIYEAYCAGDISFVKTMIDDMSDWDIQYMEERLANLGLEVKMTLD